MLIIGNNLGELKSLDLNNKHKKVEIISEDLIAIDSSPINRIKCDKSQQIFFGSSKGTIGMLNKKTKEIIKTKNSNFEEMVTFHNFKHGSIIAF